MKHVPGIEAASPVPTVQAQLTTAMREARILARAIQQLTAAQDHPMVRRFCSLAEDGRCLEKPFREVLDGVIASLEKALANDDEQQDAAIPLSELRDVHARACDLRETVYDVLDVLRAEQAIEEARLFGSRL
jgi:hypothetical protein